MEITVKLKIKEQEIELTLDELKELRNDLNSLLSQKEYIRIPPNPNYGETVPFYSPFFYSTS